MTTQGWQRIETAPKDRVIDLWAKRWVASTDTFTYRRYADCCFSEFDGQWIGLDEGWRPIAWMPLPDPPKERVNG